MSEQFQLKNLKGITKIRGATWKWGNKEKMVKVKVTFFLFTP